MNSQTNTPNKELSFNTKNSFLEQLSFNNASLGPLPCFDEEPEIHSYVSYEKKSDDGQCYLVKMHTDVSLNDEMGVTVLIISLVYSTFLQLEKCSLDAGEFQNIIQQEVPKRLLTPIRSIVSQITAASGRPLVLSADTFSDSIQSEQVQYEDKDPNLLDEDMVPIVNPSKDEEKSVEEDYNLSFLSILNDMGSFHEGAGFLSTFERTININIDDLTSFDKLPTYQSYYRFLYPVAYHCPEVPNCDPNVWPLFFRLLFGNTEVKCELIRGKGKRKNGVLPELKFSYDKYKNVCLSELDPDKLKDLLWSLMMDAFCEVSVLLSRYNSNSTGTATEFPVNQLIKEEDFYKLHNFHPNLCQDKEMVEFFKKLYSRIKDCDTKSKFYRISE